MKWEEKKTEKRGERKGEGKRKRKSSADTAEGGGAVRAREQVLGADELRRYA